MITIRLFPASNVRGGEDIHSDLILPQPRRIHSTDELPSDQVDRSKVVPPHELAHGAWVWACQGGRWLAGRINRLGGPRKDPAVARVVRSFRLHPATAEAIEAESRRTGESQGQVIDRLSSSLPRA